MSSLTGPKGSRETWKAVPNPHGLAEGKESGQRWCRTGLGMGTLPKDGLHSIQVSKSNEFEINTTC